MTPTLAAADLPALLSGAPPTDGGPGADALVLVCGALGEALPAPLRGAVDAAARVDAQVGQAVCLVVAPAAPGGRLVLAPTGPLHRDEDDARRVADAAAAGLRRARDAGARRPALGVVGVGGPRYANALEVAALAGLGALWEPLEAREALGEARVEPVESLTLVGADAGALARVRALEAGRRLARDLTGTEPERMTPARMAELCRAAFAGTCVSVEVVDDPAALREGYPLLSAVARASLAVPRHHPCVVRLRYEGEGPLQHELFIAGKGLSYDTGGADLKTDGHMAGMSRDKGGAGAAAGLLLAAAHLRPAGVRIVAELGCVRNSIGADAFVSDEIIRSHAGVRVRIGNTDAEGRLVLADLLSHLREEALLAAAPRVLTIATLTGHAGRAVGPYSIAMDNGPARALGLGARLAELGDLWADPFELSRLRREDFDFIRPRSKADDVLSCNNAPSSATARGHQFPMAFLAVASGLAAHGGDSARPLPFTHIDIGGSGAEGGDWQHGRPTAAPVVALARAFFGPPA